MTDSSPEIGRSIDAGGIATNYHDVGEGEPVLLLHGSGPGVSAWANWQRVLPVLSQDFRVVAPDLLGFGFTERPVDVKYELSAWRHHVLSLLDALEIERCSFVGNSFGGALALSLASMDPDRVDKLVLMGSVGLEFELTEGLDLVWGYDPSVESMHAILSTMAFDQSLLTPGLADLRYHASIRPGVQEAFSAMFPAPRQAGITALATPEQTVAALTHEVLIVHGREDKVIPVAVSYRLFELIDRAELHVLGRCGHWTQIERADRFNDLVRSFLAGKAGLT